MTSGRCSSKTSTSTTPPTAAHPGSWAAIVSWPPRSCSAPDRSRSTHPTKPCSTGPVPSPAPWRCTRTRRRVRSVAPGTGGAPVSPTQPVMLARHGRRMCRSPRGLQRLGEHLGGLGAGDSVGPVEDEERDTGGAETTRQVEIGAYVVGVVVTGEHRSGRIALQTDLGGEVGQGVVVTDVRSVGEVGLQQPFLQLGLDRKS